MSCKTLKLNSCEILGSTFSGRTFNFADRNISQDKFTAKVKGFTVTNANEVINGVVVGSSVFFSKDSLSNLKSGRYIIEYWADFKDVANEMISLEEFLISTTPCACADDSLVHDFTLEFPTETIEYSVKSEITNIFLNFEDLTPEQILELQKPALEVIEQTEIALAKSILATESSIESTSSSVLATDKSVIATENAVNATLGLETLRENVEIATVNANDNAQLAFEASSLANQKAILADNASILANQKAELADTATQNANTATTNANNAKGWTPFFIDVADGVRVVRKLDKYIGGTGNAPTENVVKYLKSDGTYTDVIAQAIDYKGPEYNDVIVDYTHSANTELLIGSIDYTTGDITTTESHNLAVGNILIFFPKETTNTVNYASLAPVNINFSEVYYVSNIGLTTNTFKLTKTFGGGGVAVVLDTKATVDFSKFRIEKISQVPNMTNFPSGINRLKVVVKGRTLRFDYASPITNPITNLVLQDNSVYINNNGVITQSNAQRFSVGANAVGNIDFMTEFFVDCSNGISQKMSSYYTQSQVTSPFLKQGLGEAYYYANNYERRKYEITGYGFSNLFYAGNGTTIKIYKQ